MKKVIVAGTLLAVVLLSNLGTPPVSGQNDDEVRRLVDLHEKLIEKAKKLEALAEMQAQEISALRVQLGNVGQERDSLRSDSNSLRDRLGSAQASANHWQGEADRLSNHWKKEADRWFAECEKYRNCKIVLNFWKHDNYRNEILEYSFYPRPDKGTYVGSSVFRCKTLEKQGSLLPVKKLRDPEFLKKRWVFAFL